MSEQLAVCQTLAAMIRQHGEPTEEEVTFIGMAAMQLGLNAEENEQVQKTLKDGGDFDLFLGKIESKPMRAFFLRRALAAVLLDEQINDHEQAVIGRVSTAFGCSAQQVADLIAWMKVGVEVDKRLNTLFAEI